MSVLSASAFSTPAPVKREMRFSSLVVITRFSLRSLNAVLPSISIVLDADDLAFLDDVRERDLVLGARDRLDLRRDGRVEVALLLVELLGVGDAFPHLLGVEDGVGPDLEGGLDVLAAELLGPLDR